MTAELQTRIIIRSDAELQGIRRATSSIESLGQQIKRAAVQLGALFGIAGGAQFLRNLVETADAYKQVNARLQLVSRSTQDFASAQQALFRISQETRGGLEGTVDLYARLARSTQQLGTSQTDLLGITRTINQAVAVSGASAASASAALFQLGQGLAAGALRGEELNSVLEQTPRLAQAIADGLGIEVGALRQMGAEGQLTAEKIVEALKNQADTLDEEFRQLPTTVDQAMTQVGNAWTRYIGRADAATGATRTLAGALSALAENLQQIIDLVIVLGETALVAFTVKWLGGARAIGAFAKTGEVATGVIASLGDILRFGLVAALTLLIAPIKTLRALFGRLRLEMAGAAKNAVDLKTAVGRLQSVFAIFVGYTIGLDIGRRLHENFEVARRAGAALASGVVEAGERIKGAVEIAGENIRFFLSSPLDYVRTKLADLVKAFADFARGVPGIGEAAARALSQIAGSIRPDTEQADAFEARVKAIQDRVAARVQQIRDDFFDILQLQNAAAEGRSDGDQGGGGGGNDGPISAVRIDTTRARLEAEAELIKDEVDRQLRILDKGHELGLVSLQDYYERRAQLQAEALDAELAATRQQLVEADAAVAQARKEASTAGTEDARTKAEGSLNDALEKQIQLQTQIRLLVRERRDIGTNAALDQAEAEREFNDALQEVRDRLAAARGEADTSREAVARGFKDLLERFKTDADGTALVNELIDVETAKARLGELRAGFERTIDALGREEARINAEREAGLIGETEARRRIVELHRSTHDELSRIIPQLRAQAELIKDPEQRQAVEDLIARWEQLGLVVDANAARMQEAVEGGLQDVFKVLLRDIRDVGDAFDAFADRVISRIQDIAAEQLADALMGPFRNAAGGGGFNLLGSIGSALFGAFTGVPQPGSADFVGPLLPSAKGNAFDRVGRVQIPVHAFARGGIVDGVTPFRYSGGLGVMGEQGPEAIVPLARDSQGRLGVRGGGSERPIAVNINISTPDAESFKRSTNQVAIQVGRGIARATRRLG